MEVVGRALSVTGRGEDCTIVRFEDFEPVVEVSDVLWERIGSQSEVNCDKGGAVRCVYRVPARAWYSEFAEKMQVVAAAAAVVKERPGGVEQAVFQKRAHGDGQARAANGRLVAVHYRRTRVVKGSCGGQGRLSIASITLPVRSRRYGVGKEIGGAVYVHRAYADRLPSERIATAAPCLPSDFQYTVLKLNFLTGAVSFIASPDFDTAPEPIVGDLWIVRADGSTRFRAKLADPYIYHHKWLFVADDYAGFDVEESRARSVAWTTLPDVDRSRIGRLSYWVESVLPRLGESRALDHPCRQEQLFP